MEGVDYILPDLTPEHLIKAYTIGIFPMSEGADDPTVFWVQPEMRGILPLDSFHLPRSLKKVMRKNPFTVKIDTAFADVIRLCAEEAPDRENTWINDEITNAYLGLHERGNAHSVECWLDGELVGGLYGVKIGAAFFGESMFSRRTNASKIALTHLVHRLRLGGFMLLDTQFTTPHLERFGVVEIPKDDYEILLAPAVSQFANFHPYTSKESGNPDGYDGGGTSDSILQSFNQIS